MKKQANFTYLLIGLLLVLIAGPVSREIFLVPSGIFVTAIFAGTMILSLWSLQESRVTFGVGIATAALMIALAVVNYLTPSQAGLLIALITLLVFSAMSLRFTLGQVLVGEDIDGNRLIGAICAYLLIGVIWALLYALNDLLLPGSFNNVSVTVSGDGIWELFYYSFVTMTTLGYGDVTPMRPLAQMLAYMESLVGQLYVAILVGALVGMFISNRLKSN